MFNLQSFYYARISEKPSKSCVQFLHSGSEHTPDRNNRNHISWNQDAHKRKFMKNPGIYLKNNRQVTSDLIFSREWETQSDVIQKFKTSTKGELQYLYQLYFSLPQHNQFLQNTDPVVFGDNFYYVFCQQVTKRGFTQLRYLEQVSHFGRPHHYIYHGDETTDSKNLFDKVVQSKN